MVGVPIDDFWSGKTFSAGGGSLNSDRRVNFCDCELYRFWWLLFITTSSVSLVPYNFAKPFSSPSFVSDSETPGPFIIIISLFFYFLLPTPSIYTRFVRYLRVYIFSQIPIEPQKLHSDKTKRGLEWKVGVFQIKDATGEMGNLRPQRNNRISRQENI